MFGTRTFKGPTGWKIVEDANGVMIYDPGGFEYPPASPYGHEIDYYDANDPAAGLVKTIYISRMTYEGPKPYKTYGFRYTFVNGRVVYIRRSLTVYGSGTTYTGYITDTSIIGLYGTDDPNGGYLAGDFYWSLGPSDIESLLASDPNLTGPTDPNDPAASCSLDTLTHDRLTPFASQIVHRYSSNVSPVTGNRFIESRTLSASCGGCGGGASGGSLLASYGDDYEHGITDANHFYNKWQYYRRVYYADDANMPETRVVYFKNSVGQVIYRVEQEMDPNGTIARRWVTHNKYDAHGNLIERRYPSACTGYSLPQSDNWTTSVEPVSSGTAGLSRLYGYDANDNLIWEKVRPGISGDVSLVKWNEYAPNTYDGSTLYRVVTEKVYPTSTSDPNDPNAVVTTHVYEYLKDANEVDTHVVLRHTTTLPAVTPDKHGPNQADTRDEVYACDPNNGLYYVQWQKREGGEISYEERNEYDQMVQRIEDVNTTLIEGEPNGFSNTTGRHLVTTYAYDDQGRVKKITEPDDRITYLAYEGQTVYKFPCWDPNTAKPRLPIEVSESRSGKLRAEYSVDPNAVELDPNSGKPIGLGASTGWDEYFTLTTYDYTDSGELQRVRRFHSIPNDPNSVQAGQYLETEYGYDSRGRKLWTKEPTGVITFTEYDKLGRVGGMWQGTALGTEPLRENPNNGGAAGDMFKAASRFYDSESDPNAGGVGDGYVTANRQYYDANDYLLTTFKHDYLGRNTQTRSPAEVITVNTYDGLGRLTAVETYADLDHDSNADPNERRAKAETRYDQRDQVYQEIVHDIDPNDGSDDGSVTTKHWYDATRRRIKTETPDHLLAKTFYDTAGNTVAEVLSIDANESDDPNWQDANDWNGDTVYKATFYKYSRGRQVEVMAGTTLGGSQITDYDNPNAGNPAGNLVTVAKMWYDDDFDNAESDQWPHVTAAEQVRTHNGSTFEYVRTEYEYDATGRQHAVVTPDPDGTETAMKPTRRQSTFDDLGRPLQEDTYYDPAGDNKVIARTIKTYDASKGYLTAQKTYAVDPNGVDANSVGSEHQQTAYAYDTYGRRCKVTQPSGAFVKTLYTKYGRQIGTYLCTAEGNSTNVDDPNDDTVVEQTIPTYDSAGRVTVRTRYERTSTSGKTGDLSASWSSSDSRRSYTAAWYDGLGRQIRSANYGTNDNDPYTWSSTPPDPNSSDNVIVAKTEYDGYGRPYKLTDNKNHVVKRCYDAMGRPAHVIENYQAWAGEPNTPPARDADVNRMTVTTYTPLGQPATLTAVDPNHDGDPGDNQLTTYTYSTGDANDCLVPRRDILVQIKYPDGDDANDNVKMTYHPDGLPKTKRDQRGVVHEFAFDALGRLTADRVTTIPAGVDDNVQSLAFAYDKLGRRQTVTSWSDPNMAATAVNQVTLQYDSWGNLAKSYQEPDGSVDANTLYVEQVYTAIDMGNYARNVRLSSVVYPDRARTVSYSYGASGSIDDRLNRLSAIAGTTFTYLGAGTVSYSRRHDYAGGFHLTRSFDRFGRLIDQNWHGPVSDRTRYGYDRNSNRLWRQGSTYSEFYDYDGLDRLTESRRGTLSGSDPNYGPPASPIRRSTWDLSAVGNWGRYMLDTDGDGDPNEPADLNQTRAHNTVNEITGLAEQAGQSHWVTPAYDAAGNMMAGPKPGTPAAGETRHLYVYDAWNRLAEVWEDADDSGGITEANDVEKAAFSYDGLNRRVRKIAGNDTYDEYYSPRWQLLEVRKDSGAAYWKQYLWDDTQYIDAPICLWTSSDGRMFYTFDGNFNVTSLVGPADEGTLESYSYDPYGQVTINGDPNLTASPLDNDILYAGYRYDPETGLYLPRHRYYHPGIGRWTRRDPQGYVDGPDLFQYARSSPIRLTDPFGLKCGGCFTPPGRTFKRAVGVSITPGGGSPNYQEMLEAIDMLELIDNVAAMGNIASGAAQSLNEFLLAIAEEAAEEGASVNDATNDVLNDFFTAITTQRGYGVYVRVESRNCVRCGRLEDLTALIAGTCPRSKWKYSYSWHQCTTNSVLSDLTGGLGTYGGQLAEPNNYMTPALLRQCMRDAVK